jgi:sarcosine oxidase, subunit beta
MILPGVTSSPLRSQYDVVIVGAGVAGLSVAYELAKAGVGNVAVLERAYPGAGASGRNGELIRSAFSSTEWCGLFNESLRRWHGLSDELDFNILFAPNGYAVIASTEEQLRRCERDVERQKAIGVESSFVTADELLRIAPVLNPEHALGGMYQASGGYAHHDAVVWGYTRAAARLGVEIHAGVTVTEVTVTGGRVRGVRTDKGEVSTAVLVNAAGGHAGRLGELAGVRLPLKTCRLEAIVTEPMRPFLRPGLGLLEPLGYCHQTTRGEFVGGTELPKHDETYSLNVTFHQLVDMATKFVRMMPVLSGLRLVRHWAGLVSQTPDIAPLLGSVPEVDGFVLNCGHVYGFMAAPAAGACVAQYIRDGRMPQIAAPFDVDRFRAGRQIREGSIVVAVDDEGGTGR